MELLKPERLRPGDQVATVSLSSGLLGAYPEVYAKAKGNLRDLLGLNVVEAPNATREGDWLYRHPEARADDLHWALANPEVKAVFSAIGGYESVRILPYLKPELIREHPKVFLGFSDTTIQHAAFLNAGVVSFHGPSMLAGLATLKAYPYTLESLKRTLFSPDPVGLLEPAPGWTYEVLDWATPNYAVQADSPRALDPADEWAWLQGETQAQGHLVGGNIEVLEMLKGTRWWPAPEVWQGAILYLETSEEAPPVANVEYWLRNYASQGILQEASGLLFARPFRYSPEMTTQLYSAVRKVLAECDRADMPVVANLDFGHATPMLTLPNGCQMAIDPVQRSVAVLEGGVS